jgi:hypothetical protein
VKTYDGGGNETEERWHVTHQTLRGRRKPENLFVTERGRWCVFSIVLVAWGCFNGGG